MKIDWVVYRSEQNAKGTISNNFVLNSSGTYDHLNFNLELPYNSNSVNISCVVSGIYPFEKRNHQTRGRVIRILNVTNRTSILTHVGNFLKDTQGCILPCLTYSSNKAGDEYIGQNSKDALNQLWERLPNSGYVHIVSQN